MESSSQVENLKDSLKEQGVRYCLPSYVDIHGVSKSKFVPIEHFDRMMAGSELCTGAALDGVPQEVNDEEVSSRPDPASAIVLPWQKDVAWFASDLWCDGKPFEPCSRNIFKGVLGQAATMGYTFNFGIEPEFFLLKQTEHGEFAPIGPRDDIAKPAYDIRSTLDSFELLEEIVETLNDLGYDVYSYDHEDGNGQFEIDFMYSDGLTMADRFVFFRHLIQELAHRKGYFATFMPKPFSDRAGSGAHYNMSLADIKSGENLFEAASDPRGCGITQLGYWFIGGILKHLPALAAVISPTVNSYKRLIKTGSMSGFTWAPVFACFGNNNRTNSVRVPSGGGRVELRAADIANNPYLGGAMVLAAGLEGIREQIDPGAPHTENMYLKSDEELAQMGVSYLPRTLGEAVDAFEADDLGRQVMGDLMFKTFVDFKRGEWREYLTHVSDWEVDRYLKLW